MTAMPPPSRPVTGGHREDTGGIKLTTDLPAAETGGIKLTTDSPAAETGNDHGLAGGRGGNKADYGLAGGRSGGIKLTDLPADVFREVARWLDDCDVACCRLSCERLRRDIAPVTIHARLACTSPERLAWCIDDCGLPAGCPAQAAAGGPGRSWTP